MKKWLSCAFLVNVVFLSPAVSQTEGTASPLADCLPSGVKLNHVVEVITAGLKDGQPVIARQITVEEKLTELKAICSSEAKLVDGQGREIVFYSLIGCWGHPPPDYEELLQKQRSELERLRQQFTVIEMTCNPSATHLP